MFSSFTTFSNPFGVPRFLKGTSSTAINLPSVEIHDVETNSDKRARALKHLLKLNHANYAILFHDDQFHNHAPHILGSAYLLSAPSSHLNAIYESETDGLSSWRESPGEISTYDWRDYLSDRRYQRAYVDFFEDQVVLEGYDWKKVLNKYLFEGKEPLFNNLVAGLGHPLIHLGYAYELNSREVAMEALGLATCCYNYLHKYLDNPTYSKPSSSPSSHAKPTTSTLDILAAIRKDPRFDDLSSDTDMKNLLDHHEAAVLEHWNSWQTPEPKTQFEESQSTATALLVGSVMPKDGSRKDYDFFLVHLLTTSHAVRIILPLIPPQYHVRLVKQWWLVTVLLYTVQGRPEIDLSRFVEKDPKSRGWDWVDQQAREGKHSLDAHFVKALRAMKVAQETWGKASRGVEGYWLKAAIVLAEEFNGWGFKGVTGHELEAQKEGLRPRRSSISVEGTHK